ncbi:ATP-binding protein [Rhizobium bangladeshense]|uniref:ATP-binding protein n=1 Tax=Rhizobium bangladeshense TaxID=1138189 RepID=UPI001C92A7D0|nr:ATP-binding protein [Rhizobium bangladeshense]MBY3597878.1 ATP-binding protein [Rhizobium bangladeshense]
MATLSLLPGQDHLEKVAKTSDPLRGLSEFVWNALDGDALNVTVVFEKNALGGLHAIRIIDDGLGIRPSDLRQEYSQLGESWKKHVNRTAKYGRAMHGKEGRGRLRFFSLAGSSEWRTRFLEGGKAQTVTATIEAAALGSCDVSEPVNAEDGQTGTVVELHRLKDTFDWLVGEEAFQQFNAVFAAYVLQYPNVSIEYDGRRVSPEKIIARKDEMSLPSIPISDGSVTDLHVRIIEWKGSMGDRRLHLGADDGIALASQPAGVTAPGFSFSAYAYSKFFEKMHAGNLLELDSLTDPDLTTVLEYVRDALTDHFRTRQSQQASNIIAELIAEGSYPYEGEPKSEVETRERQVFDIATYAVSSYSREFKRAEPSLKKITLALLREAVRHNPESVTNILRAVINLPKARQDEFSSLLERTELSNIIAASSMIADRVTAIQVIRQMVSDPEKRLSVKERGELDLIVQANTWIFGEQFHIALPEAGLTRVMKRVAEDLGKKPRKGRVTKRGGKIARADAFLGRVIPHPVHEHREYLLIELKRPKTSVGRDEFDQIEDYASALISQPEYENTSTSWNFFLMTTDVDKDQEHRITQDGRPPGLFLDLGRAKVWVKKWGEVLRLAEARLQFVQDVLKVEVTDEEIDQRVTAVKSSLLRQRKDAEAA